MAYEQCNGKINFIGRCDRCGQKSEVSSAFCSALVEFSTTSETTPKENSAHSFTEGMDVPDVTIKPVYTSETKLKVDPVSEGGIICPFCGEKGFDKPGLKYHINVYCVPYMNTEEL